MIKHTKKGAGGKREGTGRKNMGYVSREVKLPKEDNEAIKAKFGRSFNQVFRDWIKTLIS